MNEDYFPILELLARYYYLTTADLMRLLGRSDSSIRRSLRNLKASGFTKVKYIEQKNIYFLTPNGEAQAKHYGLASEDFFAKNGTGIIEHDYNITRFHLALVGPHLSYWNQPIEKEVFGAGAIFPDAVLTLKTEKGSSLFFLEMVRANDSKHKQGKSYFQRNLEDYLAYYDSYRDSQNPHGFTNFRVLIIVPTKRRVEELIKKLSSHEQLATRRFWITDYESCFDPAKVLSAIWTTPSPKDYQRLYSLVE
jgi:hypothetical protein